MTRCLTKNHRSIRIKKFFIVLLAFASVTLLAACGGAPAGGWSSAAVSDSTVYFGGTNGKFYALDANTGALKWTYSGEQNTPLGSIYGEPAVANGVVYFGTLNGTLYALNANDHSVKWTFDATAASPDQKGLVASPVVADGVIYIGANDHNFFAVDAATGKVKWKFTAQDKIWGAATIVNQTIYFGSLDHHLYALNLDGSKKWDFDAGGMILGQPLVDNNAIYVGALGKMFALTYANGRVQVKWQQSLDPDHWIWSSPTIQDNVVYVGDLGGQVHAFDAQTGAPKWTYAVPAPDTSRAVRGSVVVTDSLAFVGTGNNDNVNAPAGKVYALDASSGQPKWSFPTQGSVFTTPSLADQTLYVMSHQQVFYALNEADGTLKWAFNLAKDTPGTPAPQ
jgi:eukaryotic-like serine/threonine-protein kinase